MTENIKQVERYSVQTPPDAKAGERGDSFWYWNVTERGDLLPQWGTRARERYLRAYYRHELNGMVQSAFAGLIKKVKSAPWEIKGKRRVSYFQDVLRGADFGRGWGSLLSKVLLDFLRQDGGGYIEVIAPGNPMKAPTGPVVGLAPLDSYRCLPTGDPEYPVTYYNRKGALHLLHRTRVIQLVDMPDADESQPGYGLCALSRAINIVAQQIYMGRYVTQQLDDKPQPGIMVASGTTKKSVEEAFRQFKDEGQRDELPPWGRTVWFASTDPTSPISIQQVTFSQPPAGWSYKEYNELHVNALALALGVDVQELWQLTGGNIGSGQQSAILHAKSQGKTFGDILTSLERALNDVLPVALEFAFKRHDPYEAQERAATAQLWAGFVAAAGDTLSADEKRRLLANMVEAVADTITDENGEVVRLTDVEDPEDEGEQQVADDDAPTPPAADAQANTPQQTADSTKAIQATRIDFELAFEDLLAERKVLSERSIATRLRGLLRQHGYLAYQDGLEDGGVKDGVLDADDNAEFLIILAAQNAYVNKFAKAAGTLSDTQAELKPEMWWKSIQPFYDAGRRSADRNGYYEWVLGATEEHCADCLRLNSQIHRMKDWVRKEWTPKSSRLECGGFFCDCRLVKRDGARAKGRF